MTPQDLKQIGNLFDSKFDVLDKKIDNLDKKFDKRFDEQDKKFDIRFEEQDKKFDKRFEEQDKKFDKRFEEQFREQDTKIGKRLDKFGKVIIDYVKSQFEIYTQNQDHKLLKWKTELFDTVDSLGGEIRDSREARLVGGHQTVSNTDRIERLEKKVFGAVMTA